MADCYFSVNPDGTANIRTGTPTMTISSGVATLNTAQTGNIGIGCEINYDSSAKTCYISQVNSPTSFNVVTATGGTPGNEASPVSVDSIHHVWADLPTAESNFTGASYINDTDLTAGGANVNAHLVCYTDGTAEGDETIVSGTGTDATHRIKIYSANAGTQSLTDNRHAGAWDASKFNIAITASGDSGIYVEDHNVDIEGIQVTGSKSSNYGIQFSPTSSAVMTWDVRKCIVKNTASSIRTGLYVAYNTNVQANSWAKFSNCVVYDFDGNGGDGVRWGESSCDFWAYHITVCDCAEGFVDQYSTSNAKLRNCVAFGNTDDYVNWGSADVQFCGYSEGSDPGTNGIDLSSEAGGDLFANYSGDNFHVKDTGSALYDAGTDVSGDTDLPISDDIDDDARSQWDIGADEFVGGGFVVPTAFHLFQQAGAI